jgi:hypothetical protein
VVCVCHRIAERRARGNAPVATELTRHVVNVAAIDRDAWWTREAGVIKRPISESEAMSSDELPRHRIMPVAEFAETLVRSGTEMRWRARLTSCRCRDWSQDDATAQQDASAPGADTSASCNLATWSVAAQHKLSAMLCCVIDLQAGHFAAGDSDAQPATVTVETRDWVIAACGDAERTPRPSGTIKWHFVKTVRCVVNGVW